MFLLLLGFFFFFFLNVLFATGFLLCSCWVLDAMSLNACILLLLLDFCSNRVFLLHS
jgi:hypothetical protein